MLTIDLRGNLAVITGASGMLGRVIARTFADCGADLVLHYFHGKEEAELLAGELRRKTGPPVAACRRKRLIPDTLQACGHRRPARPHD